MTVFTFAHTVAVVERTQGLAVLIPDVLHSTLFVTRAITTQANLLNQV